MVGQNSQVIQIHFRFFGVDGREHVGGKTANNLVFGIGSQEDDGGVVEEGLEMSFWRDGIDGQLEDGFVDVEETG
jgi:hypothetical protein